MKPRPHSRPGSETRRGFALIVVLLVLLALLVLCAPFLLGARNADRASTELADRTETRITLDAAARHARAVLAESHPALDSTPYHDSPDELAVDERFPEGFLSANDASGQMWRAAVEDVSGRIDLNSAPPQLFANLLGMSTRFTRPITVDDKELPVSSLRGFEPSGVIWSEGELIRYGKLGESDFQQFVRGLGWRGEQDWVGGPKPPSPHGAGAAVLDQRAFAVPLWRAAGPEGSLRTLDESATLRQCADFVLARATETGASNLCWEGEVLAPLFRLGSVYGRARAADAWQRPVRLTGSVTGGKVGYLRVESTRWISTGSTLQVYDGATRETALVVEIDNQGKVYLDRILQNDYAAWRGEVRVLARRPVNLNTAPKDVLLALFANLQLKGRNARINKDEAETLAQVVLESRPLEGWEDFLRRVVLPACGLERLPPDAPVVPTALAGGQAFLDELDALALYRNGLNANDSELVFSTLPFCFRSADVYGLELRATLNAQSGAERFTVVREQVEVVAPQRQLMHLWARQEDYDEELRLSGCAPFWMTAPSATSQFDVLGSNPPTRLRAHWGTYQGRLFLPGQINAQGNAPEDLPKTVEHVFASREATAWIQLWPMRVPETGRRAGRMIHFDNETRDMEGRYLPDEPVQRKPDDKQVNWLGGQQTGPAGTTAGLMLPACHSLWIKPRSSADACLFDVAGGSPGTDRIGLFFERGDLVLRVWDATGDHTGTTEMETGEAHYAFAAGTDAPGLPLDVWSHVAFDVRGTRPDQLSLLVNGKQHGVRSFGLTRLASAIDPSTTSIAVESIDGFPARGVVRIGDELVEYQLGVGNVLDASPQLTGAYAGFGGRLARERTVLQSGTRVPEILYGQGGSSPQAPANVGSHEAGTPVEVFGYSMALQSNVPAGGANLPAQLGAFAVGIVSKAVSGSPSAPGEQILFVLPPPLIGTIPLGYGLDGNPSTVTALELKPADSQTSQAQLMGAFNPSGGWLMLMTINLSRLTPQPTTPGQPTPPSVNEPRTAPPHNARIGGAEFIWYTGVSGNQLLLDMSRRGNATGFKNPGIGREQRAFVVDWDPNIQLPDPDQPAGTTPPVYVDPDTRLEYEVFAFPVSIPAPGASGKLLDPQQNAPLQITVTNPSGQSSTVDLYVSEYAQLTETGQAERTEWVRYDEIVGDHLVRTEDGALRNAFAALSHKFYDDATEGTLPVGPGGGGTGSGGGIGPTGGGGGAALAASAPAALAPAAQSGGGAYWSEEVGAMETSEGPITRTVSSFLQFRGVLGTFSHPHAAGTPVLPVVRIGVRKKLTSNGTFPAEPDAGRPGVDDAVFLVEDDPTLLGNPARVQRAYQPYRYRTYRWQQQAPNSMIPVATAGTGEKQFIPTDNPVAEYCIYLGLREPMPIPYAADAIALGTMLGNQPNQVLPDPRLRARLTKHPSGERPRAVSSVRLGGAIVATQGGTVPSALADEVAFGDVVFARNFGGIAPEGVQGAGLWLVQEASANSTDLYFAPGSVRGPQDVYSSAQQVLDELPSDAGLLRIGDEIVCYQSRSPTDGRMQLAQGGRGLLGSEAQPHHAHESALYLEDWTVSVLAGGVSVDSPRLELANAQDFPPEGLVLVDEELIHYSRIEGAALAMPRASKVAGRMDQSGEPLFRGRFGTTRAPHASGTPVILFPFRYWDRWAERADAPELACFDLSLDQPSAWWESCFFFKTDVDGCKVGVLERRDPEAPWDGDPEKDARLALRWQGDQEGRPLEIGLQSDRVTWRVFAKYGPDAFDPKASARHGWRQTPRLDRLGVFYHAPGSVLRSVER